MRCVSVTLSGRKAPQKAQSKTKSPSTKSHPSTAMPRSETPSRSALAAPSTILASQRSFASSRPTFQNCRVSSKQTLRGLPLPTSEMASKESHPTNSRCQSLMTALSSRLTLFLARNRVQNSHSKSSRAKSATKRRHISPRSTQSLNT